MPARSSEVFHDWSRLRSNVRSQIIRRIFIHTVIVPRLLRSFTRRRVSCVWTGFEPIPDAGQYGAAG